LVNLERKINLHGNLVSLIQEMVNSMSGYLWKWTGLSELSKWKYFNKFNAIFTEIFSTEKFNGNIQKLD
jgi:hypothetical protein